MTLMPHQRKAVDDLHAHNGVAWVSARVGAGKTPIAITYLKERGVKNALILVPKSIIKQWKEEIVKFGGDPNWTVTNYEKLLDDDFCRALTKNMPEAIVADESTKVKSPTGKVAKRFRKLQPPIRIMLAANITPNALWELYSPLQWFVPGMLGKSFYEFRNNHCMMNPYIPQMIVGYKNPDYLMNQINNYTVRVDWDGKGELPEATREIIPVEMRPDEM